MTAEYHHITALAAMACTAWGHPHCTAHHFSERHSHHAEPLSIAPEFSSMASEKPLLLSALAG